MIFVFPDRARFLLMKNTVLPLSAAYIGPMGRFWKSNDLNRRNQRCPGRHG